MAIMLNMELMIVSILILFIAAAYQDYRKREVSSPITVIAWACSMFIFNPQTFVFYFLGAWMVALICEKLKQPLAGFGDVLWFPVFVGIVNYIHGDWLILTIASILISQVYLFYKIEWLKAPKTENYGPPFLVVQLGMIIIAFILTVF
jgi:hypothetical protein